MDQSTLVASGHALIEALTKQGVRPRAAMWVYNDEVDTWKLWIVPDKPKTDVREFYRHISEAVTKNREKIGSLNPGDIELVQDNHPAIRQLRGMFRVGALSSIHLRDNMLNGFYLIDGIILLMDF